jgi:hypothetical protein
VAYDADLSSVWYRQVMRSNDEEAGAWINSKFWGRCACVSTIGTSITRSIEVVSSNVVAAVPTPYACVC